MKQITYDDIEKARVSVRNTKSKLVSIETLIETIEQRPIRIEDMQAWGYLINKRYPTQILSYAKRRLRSANIEVLSVSINVGKDNETILVLKSKLPKDVIKRILHSDIPYNPTIKEEEK